MNRLWSVGIGMVFAVALAAAPAFAQQPRGDGADPLSTNCTFTLGSGDLKWCVSENGNLTKFESPNGFEAIRLGVIIEGYAVCASGLGPYYDFADPTYGGSSGWGAPVTLASSGSSVTIQRITTDGRFKLVHKFTRDTNERDITITQTLTNQTGGSIGGIQLLRYADFDNGGNFDRSVRSVWSRGTHAATLSAITMKYPVTTAIHGTFSPDPSCVQSGVAAPNTGDLAAAARYDIGVLGAGKSAVTKFVYRGE